MHVVLVARLECIRVHMSVAVADENSFNITFCPHAPTPRILYANPTLSGHFLVKHPQFVGHMMLRPALRFSDQHVAISLSLHDITLMMR